MIIPDLGRRALIMGILNVTPDSFSGDGLMAEQDVVKAAIESAGRMIEEGAEILDIGGESSRPGAIAVEQSEEALRVIPVVAALRKYFGGLPLSIDTVRSSTARKALDAGASMVNDISALQADPEMAGLIASRRVPIVLMHNTSDRRAISFDENLGASYQATSFGDVVGDVIKDLGLRVAAARDAGISIENIIVDPGLGFGKSVEQNCALINGLDRIKAALGTHVLIGPSRKSFIGKVLKTPVGGRLGGTAAAVAVGVMRGADILRVHDVNTMADVALMARAIALS